MEDYGYTFEDLNGMTKHQRDFIIQSKVERMKDELAAAEEAQKASKRKRRQNIGRRR